MNRVLLKEGKHYTLGDEHSAFELTLDGLRFLIDAVADGNIVEAKFEGAVIFRCAPHELIKVVGRA